MSALFDTPDVPQPDPAIGQASKEQIALSRDVFNWWRNELAPEALDLSRRTTNEQIAVSAENRQRAGQDWTDRLRTQPVFDKMIARGLGLDALTDADASAALDKLAGQYISQESERYRAELATIADAESRDKTRVTTTTPGTATGLQTIDTGFGVITIPVYNQDAATTTTESGHLGPEYFAKQRADAEAGHQAALTEIGSRKGLTLDMLRTDRAAQENAAGIAGLDARRTYDASVDAAKRDLMRKGVDPSSGRYRGLEDAASVGRTLASVDAANKGRAAYRAGQAGFEAGAVQAGRGADPTAAYGLALTGTRGASETTNQTAAQANAGTAVGLNGMSAGVSGLNTLYGNQLNAYNAQLQAQSNTLAGLGQAAGLAAGIKWG